MMQTAPNPPAGWYPDPEQPQSLRWWDGAIWTEHRASAWQAPYGAPAPPDHSLDWVMPVNRDMGAIAAGYLGLLSLFPNPITPIGAILCGVFALRRMKVSHQLGRGRAIFGIVMGGLSLAAFLFFVVVAMYSSGNN